MKRFEFTLETVLRLRMNEEKEWENKLAAITGECASMRSNILLFESEIIRSAKDNTEIDINSLMAVSNYQKRMDSQIQSSKVSLKQLEEDRAHILKDFIEASKKRKILDKLKEKKIEDYHHLQKKDEEKKNDDLNNSKRANMIS